MVTTPPSFTPSPLPSSGMPPVVSEQPLFALSLKTFGLGGAPNTGGVTGDSFQRSTAPPAMGNAQQQLQAAYQEAEAARNRYLAFANRLNSEAYQAQLSPQALPGGSAGQPATFQPPVADPNQAQQQLQQMQQQIQQQQQAELVRQQQAAEQARLQAEQQLQQQQMQQAQAAAAQQQAPMPAVQQPGQPEPMQPAAPPDLNFASIEELNGMLANGQVQDKRAAMAQLLDRKQGNAATYELLKREAAADTSALPLEMAQVASLLRQDALRTLGVLNASQNAAAPTEQLPGLALIDQILSDPRTDAPTKIAGIQALQVLNRPGDPVLNRIIKAAAKDANPDVKVQAKSALAGEVIPLPGEMPVMQPPMPPGA